MARTVRESKLETRAARGRLKLQHEPYWRTISEGRHIGYRKGARGGKWIARMLLSSGYRKTSLGIADDVLDADGQTVLAFAHAQDHARRWFDLQAQKAFGVVVENAPYSVGTACTDYLAWFEGHRRGFRTARSIVELHIRPELGAIDVNALKAARIRSWHTALGHSPVRFRSRHDGKRKIREVTTEEAKRARKQTANRALATLKAILNRAYEDDHAVSPDAWQRVSGFENVDAPRENYPTEEEAKRLISASVEDFRRLVRGALFTGARYGELVRMRVKHFSRELKSVHVAKSKAGPGRDIPLWDAGVAFFEQITRGRGSEEFIFVKAEGGPWKRDEQTRPMKEACAAAALGELNFHGLRHGYGSALMRKGVPSAIIARAMGHTTTRMVEKFYGHLRPSDISDAIRAAGVDFG